MVRQWRLSLCRRSNAKGRQAARCLDVDGQELKAVVSCGMCHLRFFLFGDVWSTSFEQETDNITTASSLPKFEAFTPFQISKEELIFVFMIAIILYTDVYSTITVYCFELSAKAAPGSLLKVRFGCAKNGDTILLSGYPALRGPE